MKITSKDIMTLLGQKHSKDVFVPECKNGSSYGGHLRMDAWVMSSSWANRNTIVYEVKVDRGDFLNDTKYQDYLDYCNEIYFVCPPNLIQINEIPDNVGLMWTSKNATRLYTKKKAPHRNNEIPEDLYRYILMYRARIGKELNDYTDNREFWSEWLREKNTDLELGRRISKKLRQEIEKKIKQVDRENQRLKTLIGKYELFREELKEMGLDPDDRWLSVYKFEEKLKTYKSIVTPKVESLLHKAVTQLQALQQAIKEQNAEYLRLAEQ